jgi:NADPH:quinone reductase-like Zn-dependent oxidoreductase
VTWLDWHFLRGTPFLARLMAGLRRQKHKVLGIDVAGRVEAVGANCLSERVSENSTCFYTFPILQVDLSLLST